MKRVKYYRERTTAGVFRRWAPIPQGTDGSILVEFILVLPLLVVLAIGFADFGAAFRLKQRLTNGAREGARIAINQRTIDLTQNIPKSVQSVRASVVNYLAAEGLDTSFIAASPTLTGLREWTYSSTTTGDPILVIERSVVIPVGTVLSIGTRVTLNYPFSWSFGQIIGLLGACPAGESWCGSGTFTVGTQVTMRNLT